MSTANTWDDPRIIDHPDVDVTNPRLRAAAERIHSNESLHRHQPDGPVCIYCAISAARALAGATRWLLAEVGCLECGNDTVHLGLFDDQDAVVAEVDRIETKRWNDHVAEMTELKMPGAIPERPWSRPDLIFLPAGTDSDRSGRGDESIYIAFEVPTP